MTTSFAAMKKARSNSFDKLNSQLQKLSTPNNNQNEDYWKLEVDKAGNGYAIIRFLPAPQGEEMPFVRMWDHGFQGPGGWYIENSLTTLGQDDPVSEYNSRLWNDDGSNTAKEQVRKQKRRLSFHANIYVVKDTTNPQNEGKVFLYKFGKKIFDMLNDVMNPQFEDESPINPFDFWEGADFKLKARNVEGYRNYDKSEFASQDTVSNPDGVKLSDEEMETLWSSQKSLQEIIEPKNFKSYDELKTKMYKVLALDGGIHAPTNTAEDDDLGMDFTPKFQERSAPTMETAPSPAISSSNNDDDDTLEFFKGLAND
tara:strand:- start:17212 stop:18150 length:939 start_codon:yes stop_codon:yes gene_type:complete